MSFPKMLDELDVVETIALHHHTRPGQGYAGEVYCVTCKACRKEILNFTYPYYSLKFSAGLKIADHMRASPQCVVFKLREGYKPTLV
jgi:hypothetical protein